LIWGISSTVASVILRAWGIRNLDTTPPGIHRTSRNRRATTGTPPSACSHLLVDVVPHERGLKKFKN
jgi:hypothetical protein